MNINIKPQPGEFPSSEEIDKPMNQQDPGTVTRRDYRRGRAEGTFFPRKQMCGINNNLDLKKKQFFTEFHSGHELSGYILWNKLLSFGRFNYLKIF